MKTASLSAQEIARDLPNTFDSIRKRVVAGIITWPAPVMMLFSRIVLFALFQALIAAIYALTGNPHPWDASIAWWLVTASLTNLVSLFLLDRLARREGMRLIDYYRVEPHKVLTELLWLLGFIVLVAPLAYFPNILLGNWLFGDVAVTMDMMFRPLPMGVIYIVMIVFPVTIALTEMPTYYAYVQPRLKALWGLPWLAIGVTALVHAAQHMTLPLIFDGRFLLWRLLMFLPFAIVTAIMANARPRLLPYMLVVHGLLDSQLAIILLMMK
jgi:hypothetical protein